MEQTTEIIGWKRFADFGACQNWCKDIGDGGELMVLFGREQRNGEGPAVWHISISCRSTLLRNASGGALGKRVPTFEEVKEARYRFIPDEINMGMMFPPKAHWITLPNSVVIHLWEIPLEFAEL